MTNWDHTTDVVIVGTGGGGMTAALVAKQAGLAGRVDRPDLLVLGALFHDLGKGRPGDHSEVGAQLARGAMERMGFPAREVRVVATMVAHHLLLPDVATRRDLDDPTTVALITDHIHSVAEVRLLAALAEADGRATGPTAWGSWKAVLVLPGLSKPDGLAALGDGIVVAQEEGDHPVLWLHGGKAEALFPGRNVEGVAVDGRYLYAIEDRAGDGRLLRFDTSARMLTVLRDGLSEGEGVAVCPDGQLFYSEKGKGWVKRWRASTGAFRPTTT